MLAEMTLGQAANVLFIVVTVAILIRGLLLAGRLVRAVEKIAEKKD